MRDVEMLRFFAWAMADEAARDGVLRLEPTGTELDEASFRLGRELGAVEVEAFEGAYRERAYRLNAGRLVVAA